MIVVIYLLIKWLNDIMKFKEWYIMNKYVLFY